MFHAYIAKPKVLAHMRDLMSEVDRVCVCVCVRRAQSDLKMIYTDGFFLLSAIFYYFPIFGKIFNIYCTRQARPEKRKIY